MTPEETRRMADLTERMTTRCVGRYLIDLPERFVLNSESTTEIEGVKVVVRPMGRREFDLMLGEWEKQLLRGNQSNDQRIPILKKTVHPNEVSAGTVFFTSERGKAAFNRVLDLWGWKDGYFIRMPIEATDGTDMKFDESAVGTAYESSERRIFEEYKNQNDTPQKLAHLLKVYERIRGRKDTEVPTEQGSCIANGFVRGASGEGLEISGIYHLHKSRDVYFSLTTSDATKEKDTLLQRLPAAKADLTKSGQDVFRSGPRSMHGLPYEEVLMKGPADDGVDGVSFMVHGNELRTDAQRPFVILDFYSGHEIPLPDMNMNEKDALGLFEKLPKATLSPAESLALWDKVTATLRPRPGAF